MRHSRHAHDAVRARFADRAGFQSGRLHLLIVSCLDYLLSHLYLRIRFRTRRIRIDCYCCISSVHVALLIIASAGDMLTVPGHRTASLRTHDAVWQRW